MTALAKVPALKKGGGRRAFEPTPGERDAVRELVALGVRQPDVCKFIKRAGKPICEKTLRKHFSDELELGGIEANAKVAHTLFQMATSGNTPAATFFWLKCRAGWRETPNAIELSGPNGEPLAAPVPPSFIVNFVESSTPAAGDGDGD